ncbi:23S rRNA (adenine(1618)-N(6))-methyltransferase RlmF [Neptuniibacter halophilus]|uniref:23S rRNA (adenine(1618)-N(6))-methyltransferase RlmF n=1 Tax=Neptuniibacter halophilus TaxID=651666 RepID=UPI0025742387|nr:23S rRNA (adenine(1618)-N(6))-methyltransferase RlmF [Neptuniibacter halophilus]
MAKTSPANSRSRNGLHPRNPHRSAYDLDQLCQLQPELSQFLRLNPRGEKTLDFSEPLAVKRLNQALLEQQYAIRFWDLPENSLCPPVPGRADYIHHLADLLAELNQQRVPVGNRVRGLDIGTGASCIYPILGSQSYGWRFVATDINAVSLAASGQIVAANPVLKGKVECRQQPDAKHIFHQVIRPDDLFDFTLCNPPFHASAAEAASGSLRKQRNLQRNQPGSGSKAPQLNFAGQGAELWCEGGELGFLRRMIKESSAYAQQCLWFTSLVSKKDNLSALRQALKQARARQVRVVDMAQGQKQSRFIAWSFLSTTEQQAFADQRWKR